MLQLSIILICFLSPLFILWLTYKYPILNKVGTMVLAYAIGCLLGLTGIIPSTDEAHATQTLVATITIPLAIPLMLFSADIKAWMHLAPMFLKSLLMGILACVGAALVSYAFCCKDYNELYANICGMLTGLYTGGNANLASLKVALNVSDEDYLLINTYDMAASAIYLIFVIFFGQKVLQYLLPRFKGDKDKVSTENITTEDYSSQLFMGLFRTDNLKDLLLSILLTLAVVGVGAGVAMLFPSDMFQSIFILAISTFAVLASLNKRVKSLKRTFEAGTYFILVFSIAVSSQMNLSMFSNPDPTLLKLTFLMTFLVLIFHVVLNALLRIDVDTTLTTSISLICSPPFVPVISSVLGNKAVIGPGIVVGLCGYTIGTYLGFGVAMLLQWIG